MTTTLATPTVDRDRAQGVLVAAFVSDPVIRWIYPDARGYFTYFPELLAAVGDLAFPAGTADCAEGYAGAALWLAPDVELDGEVLGALLLRSVDQDRHDDLFAFLGQMEEHHPTAPCWYLPFIGVDPLRQGRGHGSRLLAQALVRCDGDGLAAYLEASSPGNRALYERHGFAVTGEIRAGDSPPLWPMVRLPR
jgi:ribosomal protein S18 acetylase RimI-like enzyme